MRSQICVWVAREKNYSHKKSKRNRYDNTVYNLSNKNQSQQQKVLDLLRKFK